MKKTILPIAIFCTAWSIIMALTADVPLLKNSPDKAQPHLKLKRRATAKIFVHKTVQPVAQH